MMNPFTDLSQDARLAVNIDGFLTKLRVPQILHDVAMHYKPDDVSLGDWVRAMILKDAIHTLNSRHAFREIYDLLGTVFGLHGDRWVPAGDRRRPHGTDGTDGAGRHQSSGKSRPVGKEDV